MTNDKMMQTVILHMTDGSKAVFTGPAQIGTDKPAYMERIEVTEPKPLPEGCHWDKSETEATHDA